MSKLTVDDIEVPEGMLQAAIPVYISSSATTRSILAAALLWLAENPIVPSEKEMRDGFRWECMTAIGCGYTYAIREWQRRMFLRKQDALPDEVVKLCYVDGNYPVSFKDLNDKIREAYLFGKEGK